MEGDCGPKARPSPCLPTARIVPERQGADPYRAGLPVDVQWTQADLYGAFFTMFMRYPQITRVTLWGVGDGDSWLNNFPVRGRTNHPLLFDRQLQPKPAFLAVRNAVQIGN